VCPYGTINQVGLVTLDKSDLSCDTVALDVEKNLDDSCNNLVRFFDQSFAGCLNKTSCANVTLTYPAYSNPFVALPTACANRQL
jgi:hypothetical protein